jgi:hypothetical protein
LHNSVDSSRPAGVSARGLAVLVAVAGALVAAFFLAPSRLAASGSDGGLADRHTFVEAVRKGFVGYWSSGDPDLSPDMERVVDYWFRYHVVKAVIAAILLVVLIAIGLRLWKAFRRAGGLAIAAAGVLVTTLGILALVTVMANVQGAVAPFTSLVPMLVGGSAHGRLADSLDQVRQRLRDSASARGQTPPTLDVMLSDFSRYHAAMAVIAAAVAVVLIGTSVILWRRFATTASSDRRMRYAFWSFGVVTALLSLVVIVVAVANTGTAADPAPAFAAFLGDGT